MMTRSVALSVIERMDARTGSATAEAGYKARAR